MKLIGQFIYGRASFIAVLFYAVIGGIALTIWQCWIKPMAGIRALQAIGLALLLLVIATLLPASAASASIAWWPPIKGTTDGKPLLINDRGIR